MAIIDFSGVEAVIRQMEGADLYDEETQNELLFTGADVVRDCIREEMERSHFDLRDMAKNVKYSKSVKTDKNGARSVTITVFGKNEKGVSNALITFVLNYGRSKRWGQIIGDHFWNRGRQKGEQKAIQAVSDAAAKKLSERGLSDA